MARTSYSTIHGVLAVRTDEIKSTPNSESVNRTLIILDDSGHRYQITLFAGKADSLEVKAFPRDAGNIRLTDDGEVRIF